MTKYKPKGHNEIILGEAAAKVRKLKYDKQTEATKAVSQFMGQQIHENTLSCYERGYTKMPVSYLVALCKCVYGDKWLQGVAWILRKAYDE